MELDVLFIYTGCTLFIRYAYWHIFPSVEPACILLQCLFLRAKNFNVDEVLFLEFLYFLIDLTHMIHAISKFSACHMDFLCIIS